MTASPGFDSIVVVTRRTSQEELITRFNTKLQARFYIEQQARLNSAYKGGAFEEYQQASDTYQLSLQKLKKALPRQIKTQIIERSYLPSFKFSGRELVITIGPDGLVINTAKYVSNQPILAFNPDPKRIDGILIPFQIYEAGELVARVLNGDFAKKSVSMAKAQLNDGQVLYAVNDFFIGAKTHISAKYTIQFQNCSECQSSSGVIVSTGAGSTGWLQAIITGAFKIVESYQKKVKPPEKSYCLDWSSDQLYFVVREPFISVNSKADIVFGQFRPPHVLTLTSNMPECGVIFSDGFESDFLNFNSGTTVAISLAERKANLIVR